jgi:YbbR domain-containing protein
MRNALTENWGWKLGALGIAIALWMAVAREPELLTSLPASLEFKSMPEDLDFGANVPDHVQLEVRGQSTRLSRESLADVGVILDLSDARPGERTYTIQARNVNLPSDVTFERAVPSQITLRFERLVIRQVSVKPRYVKMADGYHVRTEIVEPSHLQIRGPEERVKNIERIMTDPVDLSGVVSEREYRTHANAGDPQVRIQSPGVIKLKVTLARDSR